MMHSLLANLTSVLLALHTVLGCCWHHAHSCTEAYGVAASVASSDLYEPDHAQDDGAAPSHGHHGRHDCQGNTCVFLSRTETSARTLTFEFNSPPAMFAPCAARSACDVVGEHSCFASDVLLPPLRLHLVCQVLLI